MRHVDINSVFGALFLFPVRIGWIFFYASSSISSFYYFYLYLGAVDFVFTSSPFLIYPLLLFVLLFYFSWHGAWEKMDATVEERKLMRE